MPLTITVEDNDTAQKIIALVDRDDADQTAKVRKIVIEGVDVADGLSQIDFPGLIKALNLGPVLTTPFTEKETPVAAKKAPAAKKTAAATKAPATRKATEPVQTAKKAAGTTPGRRAWRKCPDDFAEAVKELGPGRPALMARYDAPSHTVAGWLKRLRASEARAATG